MNVERCKDQIKFTDDWWPRCEWAMGHAGDHGLVSYGYAAIFDEDDPVDVDVDDVREVTMTWTSKK